jgi:cell division protein FtsW
MRVSTTLLVVCVMSLVALGLVMLSSASAAKPQASFYQLQFLWAGFGLLGLVLACAMDYRWLNRWAAVPWLLLAGTAAVLVLVLVIGPVRNGARRWLVIAGQSVQPSEFAKITLVVVLAWWGHRWQKRLEKGWSNLWFGLVAPGLLVGLILVPILLEPDVGTTVLLGAVAGLMLFVAGTRLRYLCLVGLLAGAALGWFVYQYPDRVERVLAVFSKEKYARSAAYQAEQAKVALGAGGLKGLGLGNGRQKLGFVPEHHTDFIFSVVGEELGLLTTLLVLAGYAIVVGCGMYIAWHASDTFGMLLATGISSLIGLQAMINIGVVTGSLPTKGFALPFLSYGGSNLVTMLICVGLLLSVAGRASTDPRRSVQNPFALAGTPM